MAALCLNAVLPKTAVADVASATVPRVVLLAARTNRAMMRGVVVNERHITVAIAAGPVHYGERNDALVMMQAGAFTRLQYLTIVKNGRPLSARDIAAQERIDNAKLVRGHGFFKQPFDRTYLRDYSYHAAPCTCSANQRAIAFVSRVRDSQHGDGSMLIDSSTGRVLNITYTPNVLPKYASTATTTESFGEPMPGLWCIVRIDRTYSGHVAFFGGHGRVTEALDHFSRPGSVNAAFALLGAAR